MRPHISVLISLLPLIVSCGERALIFDESISIGYGSMPFSGNTRAAGVRSVSGDIFQLRYRDKKCEYKLEHATFGNSTTSQTLNATSLSIGLRGQNTLHPNISLHSAIGLSMDFVSTPNGTFGPPASLSLAESNSSGSGLAGITGFYASIGVQMQVEENILLGIEMLGGATTVTNRDAEEKIDYTYRGVMVSAGVKF